MKKINTLTILLFASIIIYSCKGEKTERIITTKTYQTFMRNPMPNGICRFFYKEYTGISEHQEFCDSCYKYNVGDTIVGTKKH
jgi:hypothetical protein